MRSATARGIYHVAHEQAHNPTLGELIELSFEQFEQHPEFRKKRILRPLFSDYASFELLAESVETFAGAVTRQALQSMTPFARQLYSHKAVSNARLRRELPDYAPPDHRAQLAAAVHQLITTRWGRGVRAPAGQV